MAATDDTLGGTESGSLFSRLQTHYGLRADPLDMDSPFFPDAQRQHALETLRHLCGFGDMVLLLTGPKGTGKTRILAELIRGESSRLSFHRLPSAALTSTQALSRELLNIAHQSLPANSSPRDAVYGFFRWSESSTRRGQRLVLLVDNADQVPQEVINLLALAFRAADATSAAVPVLSGSDDLVQALGMVDQGVHQIHLKPLSKEDVRRYLEPRVQVAGGKTEELLSGRNLARIHELSQGSFGRLKRVAPAVWLDLASPPRRAAGPGLAALRWPALALILLALSWWLVSKQYDSVSEPAESMAEAPVVVRKMISVGPERSASGADSVGELPGQAVTGDEGKRRTNDTVAGSGSGGNAPPPAPEPLRQDDRPHLTQVSDEALARDNNDQTAVPPAASEAAPQAGLEESAVETLALGAGPADSGSASAGSEAEAVEADSEPGSDIVELSLEQAIPAAQTEVPGSFEPALPGRFIPAEEVRDSAAFTAQFIAGFEEGTAEDFLNRHKNIDQLQYTLSERKGQPWFVVFYGRFDSEQEARAAQDTFPPALRQQQPWIRPLGTL
ncbi:AAA family ATPase [Marinobacter salicampi]|uniref:AAA family ATPase n=1 Tax=Marinobacter salicampi TaxID=435907 RepID=UPI001F5F4C6F|nr:AAA family ATPase [Marinobacter salicampi]